MEFTLEQFSEELKNSLTDKGKKPMSQSERTFKSFVERIYKRLERSNSDFSLEEAVTEYIDDFNEVEGNIRKEKADFAKKWEDEHKPTKKGSAQGDDKADVDNNDFLERISNLENIIKELDERGKADKKKKELTARMKEAGIDDEKWADKYISKLSINGETDVDKEKDDALELFNLVKASTTGETNVRSTSSKEKEDDLSYLFIKKPND